MHHQKDEVRTQDMTQEEFDLKKEAEYETYGLHIRKVHLVQNTLSKNQFRNM